MNIYGSTPAAHVDGDRMPGLTWLPGKRRRFNITGIALNVVVPVAVFAAVSWALSFRMRYDHPFAAWMVFSGFLGATLLSGVNAYFYKLRERTASWHFFFTFALGSAALLGGLAGNYNFEHMTEPAFDIHYMATYPSVSPAREKGQELMDAGQVYFHDGTGIDLRKSMSFTNSDRYCVAPIVNSNEQLASYDFWAVGVNCCGGDPETFHCGEFNNPHARAGLRLMNDEQRQYFRLAVQQAEAAYNVKATHPLFFTWMQDPLRAVNELKEEGEKFFYMSILVYSIFNFVAVFMAVMLFSKIGYY